MLNEFVTELTERYHDVGHIGPAIDQMMDMGGGFGHRVEFGHDLDGFLRSYELEGFHGIHGWMDHMLKDFTSPAGIPLPFSGALIHLTPIDLNDAVNWLSVNAADFVELGAEAAAVQYIECRFSENRIAYNVALVVGMALGFADDNPLLIAFSGAKWLLNAKRNLARASPELDRRIDGTIDRSLRGFEIASYWSLGGDVAAHLLHLSDVLPYLDSATDGIPILDSVVGLGEGAAGVIDGLATFALVFGARRAVRSLFRVVHGVMQREAARLADKVRPKMVLIDLLGDGAPPAALVGSLSEMQSLPATWGGQS